MKNLSDSEYVQYNINFLKYKWGKICQADPILIFVLETLKVNIKTLCIQILIIVYYNKKIGDSLKMDQFPIY